MSNGIAAKDSYKAGMLNNCIRKLLLCYKCMSRKPRIISFIYKQKVTVRKTIFFESILISDKKFFAHRY